MPLLYGVFLWDLTKVGNLGVFVGVEQDVLGFEVSVDHHVPVTVVHS